MTSEGSGGACNGVGEAQASRKPSIGEGASIIHHRKIRAFVYTCLQLTRALKVSYLLQYFVAKFTYI